MAKPMFLWPCKSMKLSKRDDRVRAAECPQNAEGVAALNCNRKMLAKERSRSWFVRRLGNPTADFLDEVNGLLAPGSRRLNRHRNEIDACCDVGVLLTFLYFCCCCR